jgi:hypothetical protein
LIDKKWPTSRPDFYKIENNNKEYQIKIKGNSNLQEEFYNYALKFKKTAHILTTYLLETPEISKLDSYFFSIAYLYRHSLELIMKAIGFKYITKLNDRKNFINNTFHNLSCILIAIEPYVNNHIVKNRGAFTWLQSIFDDMNEIDKESDSFRYPFGITVQRLYPFMEKQYGIKVFFEKQTHIDIKAFASKMEAGFDILKSYYFDLSSIKDHYKKYNRVLFEEGGGYYGQSVIGYTYHRNEFHLYVKAYTDSADYICECITNNCKLKESLFIPMCYLYRNGIELAMKEILFEECSYDSQDAIKLLKERKHSIFRLWKSIKVDIEKHANAPEDDNTIDNVEKYIKQLHEIDGSSDKFRYPTNKNLDLHFKNVRRLDIKNVANFFGDMASFLNGVCMMMSAQNELQAEIESEYRAQMQAEYSSYDYN